MAEEAVQLILEGLRQAQTRRAEAMRAGQEQERIKQQGERDKAQKEHLDAMLAEEIEQHKATNAHQAAILKSVEAQRKLKEIEDQQRIIKGYSEGAPIPGAQVVGQETDPSGYTYHTLQLPESMGINEQGQVPGVIGNVPLPLIVPHVMTPETNVRRTAEWNEALEGPKRETLKQQEDARYKQTTDLEAAREKAAEGRQQRLITSQQIIAAGNQAARRYAADVAHRDVLANFDPAPLVEGVLTGHLSDKDVLMHTQDKKKAALVFQLAQDAGGSAISDKQKELLGNFRPAFAATQMMEEYNQLLKTNPNQVRFNPLSDASQRARTLQKQIAESLIQMTAALGQRQSDIRARAAMDAYGPSSNPFKSNPGNNEQIRHDYEKYLIDTFYDKFGNLPDKQRRAIVSRLENETGSPQAQQQQSGVPMVKPDGTKVLVHAEDVSKAQQAGYKAIQ